MFVVIVESNEARSATQGNPIVTKQGELFLVEKEPDGWVEATSGRYGGKITALAKVWDTREAAEEFAKRWRGHPWWCRPNGNFDVVEVYPVTKTLVTIIGYKPIDQAFAHPF